MRLETAVLWMLGACALGAPGASAGAWTAPQGGAYNKFSISAFRSDSEFDAAGEKQPFQFEGEFTDATLTYYGEFGVRADLTLTASVPFKRIHYENFLEQGTAQGLYDVELGARWRFVERPCVVSLQGIAKIPGAYDEDDRLPLGNGQADFEMRLLFGQAPGRGRLYYGVEGGYRYRAEAPSDEWRWLVELGGAISRRVYARAKLDGIESADNADDVRDVFGNPVATLSAEIVRLEVTLGLGLGRRWSAEATWAPILDGRSTADGATAYLAAIYSF